jgi:glycerol uptake facilitator-like aquaporin
MKSYIAEFVGTALLLAIVAGSGIMGDTLVGRKCCRCFIRKQYRDRSGALCIDCSVGTNIWSTL